MNGVAVARYGLILWQNEATSLRKVFKCLPGLWDAILNSKNTAKIQKPKNVLFYRIFFIYSPNRN